ncbi:MAG: hypothetical protein KH972_07500 [Peptostreptococcaceae bacterium]|nr:hypothetical protein [Peptostreptococcaceae bacterium]
MNYDIIIAIVIALGFCASVFFMSKKNVKLDYLTELKLALLLAGMSFKDVKMKAIADILMATVVGLEKTQLSSKEKKKEAMKQAIEEIYKKTKVTLDEETLSTIIDIAVSYMQK